ncbi:Protein of unknown function [Thermobacillus xylanilyticus]|uniref:Uncharacterized protein n=1 Tax=Thermobacillus xylanilyticus TaxID=76633 RepID=A0ABM8V0M3_THEXY|nr:Protein of unknown function [Thermobacillus xylanilyticus]
MSCIREAVMTKS